MRAEARVLPELFLERLRQIVPPQQVDTVMNTFTQPKPTTFRVNTLKTAASAVREQLEAEGVRLERVSWYPDAMILRSSRLRELQEHALYRTGALYVQSLSSMVPPLVLEPQPGETALDLCAAPGSKTTQMACLMRAQGRLVANDNNRVRFFKLKANVELQAATNVELSLGYGETFGHRHPAAFDRILVDAQCSTEGRFLTSEPASYRFWALRKLHEMAHKQRRLLRSAVDALRPGGVLVYSTCTFAPEENEGVVSWMLEQCGPMVALEPIPLQFPNYLPGLTRWKGDVFDASLARTRRILPTETMEGFFLARLRKSPDALCSTPA